MELENRSAALSERDFDGNGDLNIFEMTPPSLVSCNPGQYGFYICIDAPTGKYVPSSSSRYAIDCLAGTYQASTGQLSCDDADIGHYVDKSGQSAQTACDAGTYNPNSGSTSSSNCLDASPGHYVDSSLGTGQSTQTACLEPTIQIQVP